MGKQDQKYWDDLEAMFATDGWRQLVLELKNEVYQTQADALEATSWDRVNQLKGRAETLAYIASLQETTRLLRAQAEEDERANVED